MMKWSGPPCKCNYCYLQINCDLLYTTKVIFKVSNDRQVKKSFNLFTTVNFITNKRLPLRNAAPQDYQKSGAYQTSDHYITVTKLNCTWNKKITYEKLKIT